MAKKRKASRAAAGPKGPRETNPADARLGRITSYKDVADAQDDYFDNQDKIMFDDEDDEPSSKRRRQEEPLELSDEEVLAYDDDDDDDDDDDVVNNYTKAEQTVPRKGKKAGRKDPDDEDVTAGGNSDEGWWGTSRQEYYDADNPETEGDALEEEVEAKRLQKKKLSRMAEEDFMFDQAEWAAIAPATAGDSNAPVTEVLTDFEIPADLTPEERCRILQTQYPELDHLVREFNTVQPLVEGLRRDAIGKLGTTVEAVKYWVLGCYVAALGSYFAILTSPARDGNGTATAKALNPTELRGHEVMEALVRCRNAWLKVKDMKSRASTTASQKLETTVDSEVPVLAAKKKKPAAIDDQEAAKKKLAKEKALAKKAKQAEAAVADLYDMVPRTSATRPPKAAAVAAAADSDSDFGEEEVLDARTAADKAARKKSLRFYTSQIVQKASKRHGAGRDAGGDMDIAYRARLRDREIRHEIDANSVPLGVRKGADHDQARDEEDAGNGGAVVDQDEEYYNMIASAARNKKDGKKALKEALAMASALDRVVEVEEVGEDGKRKITYAIEKNRGLMPTRRKEVRNPRVKYKQKMLKKQKKLVSMRGSIKTESKHGYHGESTGINTRVIKSRKL